jgi:hypothetical protein
MSVPPRFSRESRLNVARYQCNTAPAVARDQLHEGLSGAAHSLEKVSRDVDARTLLVPLIDTPKVWKLAAPLRYEQAPRSGPQCVRRATVHVGTQLSRLGRDRGQTMNAPRAGSRLTIVLFLLLTALLPSFLVVLIDGLSYALEYALLPMILQSLDSILLCVRTGEVGRKSITF